MPPIRPIINGNNLDALPLSQTNTLSNVYTAQSTNINAQDLAVANNRETLHAAQNDVQTQYLKQTVQNRTARQTQIAVTPEEKRHIQKGLDGKDRQVTFTTQELLEFSQMADPREAIMRAALEKFGNNLPSESAAIKDYLDALKERDGGEVKISWRGGAESGQNIEVKELKISLQNELRTRQFEQQIKLNKQKGLPPPKAPQLTTEKGDSKPETFASLTIDAPTRQAVYERWLETNGTPAMKANFASEKVEAKIDLRIEEAAKRLKAEFDPKKNGFLLNDSFVENKYQEALKTEIDRIVSETKADFRQAGLGKDVGDASETVLRTILDNHPIYSQLPDGIKKELVKFGIGVEKGTISIAAGVKGAGDFVKDAIEDTTIYGLQQAGVNTSAVEKIYGEQRADRMKFWQELSSVGTKQMSQEQKAFSEKIERGMYVTPYDYPNKAVTAGQTVPSLALGAATGGGSLPAQIIISATLQATLAGGEKYAVTNNRAAATQTAILTGVQGAIIPIMAKLPLPADLAANALMTYTNGKLEGQSDDQIFQAIVTQTAFSAGIRSSNAVKSVVANKEAFLSTLETAMGESVGKQVRLLVEEQGRPLTAEEGGAIYRTAGKDANEVRYMQTVKTKQGVQLREITSEQFQRVTGTLREVEISNRQFDAANSIRLTAEGKVTTTVPKKLSMNLETVQGIVQREPRFVTPTTSEFFRKAEVVKGLSRVAEAREQFNISKDKNIGYADFEVDGQKWTRVGHSGKKESKLDTAPLPEKRFFKTGFDPHDMAFDSEVKILEEFAAKYVGRAKEVKGAIYLFTERPPCGSCTDLVKQFRQMFPNVRIEVASGSYVERQKGK